MSPLRFRKPKFVPRLETLECRAVPAGFHQTNLVGDDAGEALIHDPGLVNAWGVSLSPTGGAFWVSSHGGGVSPLYVGDVNGSPFAKAALTVAIPGGAPTGQVFNGTGQFTVTSGTASGPALFIFVSDTGFITGWNPAVPLPPPSRVAQVAVTRPAADYTGLAIGNNGTGNFLYAADMASGKIDVFNSTFAPTTLAGNFTDPNLPRGFVPFNVQNLGGQIYVTYARPHPRGGVDRLKDGIVNVFDLDGNFVKRLTSSGHLDAPWGLSIAPADFGEFGGALLVGNHGNGQINAFDLATGKHLGTLRDEWGRKIRIDGLFGLAFGNGVSAGDKNALYFAAGPNGGEDGLFGSLRFVADTGGSIAGLMGSSGGNNAFVQAESSESAKVAKTREGPSLVELLRAFAPIAAPSSFADMSVDTVDENLDTAVEPSERWISIFMGPQV